MQSRKVTEAHQRSTHNARSKRRWAGVSVLQSAATIMMMRLKDKKKCKIKGKWINAEKTQKYRRWNACRLIDRLPSKGRWICMYV